MQSSTPNGWTSRHEQFENHEIHEIHETNSIFVLFVLSMRLFVTCANFGRAIKPQRRDERSAAEPQLNARLTTDDTDKKNPCNPCNPWFNFFTGCEQVGLLQYRDSAWFVFSAFFAPLRFNRRFRFGCAFTALCNPWSTQHKDPGVNHGLHGLLLIRAIRVIRGQLFADCIKTGQ
jgi:hypothetical protein